MHSRISTVIVTVLVAISLLVVGGLAYMYSGVYNVAATSPHNALVRWVLKTTMENSVREHAESVAAAPPFSAEKVRQGASAFDKMCVACHGAPGKERGDYGRGLTPRPPDLAKTAKQWNEQELHWIIERGIKSTGMPAFGRTHSDDELWALVAFVKQLPQTTPQEYGRLSAGAQRKDDSSSASAGATH